MESIIIHPKSRKRLSIFSLEGKALLKSYLKKLRKQYGGASSAAPATFSFDAGAASWTPVSAGGGGGAADGGSGGSGGGGGGGSGGGGGGAVADIPTPVPKVAGRGRGTCSGVRGGGPQWNGIAERWISPNVTGRAVEGKGWQSRLHHARPHATGNEYLIYSNADLSGTGKEFQPGRNYDWGPNARQRPVGRDNPGKPHCTVYSKGAPGGGSWVNAGHELDSPAFLNSNNKESRTIHCRWGGCNNQVRRWPGELNRRPPAHSERDDLGFVNIGCFYDDRSGTHTWRGPRSSGVNYEPAKREEVDKIRNYYNRFMNWWGGENSCINPELKRTHKSQPNASRMCKWCYKTLKTEQGLKNHLAKPENCTKGLKKMLSKIDRIHKAMAKYPDHQVSPRDERLLEEEDMMRERLEMLDPQPALAAAAAVEPALVAAVEPAPAPEVLDAEAQRARLVRRLMKKLRQIGTLKAKAAAGEELNDAQSSKVAEEATILAQLVDLRLAGDA